MLENPQLPANKPSIRIMKKVFKFEDSIWAVANDLSLKDVQQAARVVIPAWSNEPISLLKASAVVFLIAVPDLMTQVKIIAARTY